MVFLDVLVVVLLLVIIYCLASGLFFLMREGGSKSTNMAKALTWRIVLSLCLFALLLLAYFFGWIHPHGVVAQ